MVIIIVLKPNSWVQSEAKSGSLDQARVTSRVNPSHHKNKSGYYHSFKTWFGSRPVARLESWVRLTIDSGSCKDKSGYYHSFKIQIRSWLGVRPGSRVRRVTLGWPKSTWNKNSYHRSFKTWFESQPGAKPGL